MRYAFGANAFQWIGGLSNNGELILLKDTSETRLIRFIMTILLHSHLKLVVTLGDFMGSDVIGYALDAPSQKFYCKQWRWKSDICDMDFLMSWISSISEFYNQI
ncbi:MAG: hypothetical protein R2764_06025 [Bacteroidales bacterium]